MRVYSPSSTESFIQCPVWWALKYDWQPRHVNGPRDCAAILGRAFTAGMAAFHTAQQQTEAIPYIMPIGTVDLAVQAALAVARVGVSELDGLLISDRDAATRDAIEKRTALAVRKAIEQSPIPADWPIYGVEFDCGESLGHARPDLIVNAPRGIAPVDYKLKLAIRGKSPEERDRNRVQLAQDYENSWQMYHYCWALQQITGSPVSQFFIALVTLEPRFAIELLPYEVNPESMQIWARFAESAWKDMEAIEDGVRDIYTFMPCMSRYGYCDCNLAVWKHHLDPTLMEQDYIRRKH